MAVFSSSSISAVQDSAVSVTCDTQGDGPNTYSWLDRNKMRIRTGRQYSLKYNDSQLTIRKASYRMHRGKYYCVVTNDNIVTPSLRQSTATITVDVLGKLLIRAFSVALMSFQVKKIRDDFSVLTRRVKPDCTKQLVVCLVFW